MVKKFNEFINEGFLSKTVNRAKSGEERIEEKVNSNLSELEEIDMGVAIFADKDVIINDKDKFTRSEMESYIPFFEKNGWKVLTIDVVDNLKIKDIFPFDNQYVKVISKETNNVLIFDIGERIGRKNFRHWWVTGSDYYDTMIVEAVDWEDEWAKLYTRKYPGSGSVEFPIRLIKEKTPEPEKQSNKEIKFNSKTKNDIKEGFNKLNYVYLGTYYWSKKTINNDVEENIKDFLTINGDKSKVDLSSVDVIHYPPKRLNLDDKQINSQYQNLIKSFNENVVLIKDDGKYWYCFWNPQKMYYYYCRLSIQDTKRIFSKYGKKTIIVNNQSVTDAFDEYVYQKTGKTIYKTKE